MKNSTLYIIAGADGSGKTTFALRFTQQHNLPFINSDESFEEIAYGISLEYTVVDQFLFKDFIKRMRHDIR